MPACFHWRNNLIVISGLFIQVFIRVAAGERSDWNNPDARLPRWVNKMRNIMQQIYAHAQRNKLMGPDVKYNPVRPKELGGYPMQVPARTTKLSF